MWVRGRELLVLLVLLLLQMVVGCGTSEFVMVMLVIDQMLLM